MTTRLHLALLVCDTPRPQILEEYGDYPRMFSHVFKQASENKNVEITWEYFDVVHKQEYPDLRELQDNRFNGVVITGSAASAYKDDPWILRLVEFVRILRAEPYKSKIRLVGICFGHQIIGRACGAHCEKNPNGWEFGIVPVTLTALGQTFFRTSKPFLRLHQVHQDHVKDLPPGLHSLATTAPHTPVHAFLSDDNQCITIQGHPEFDRNVVRMLIRIRSEAGIISKEFAEEQLAKMDSESDSHDDDIWLIGQFIEFLLGKKPMETLDYVFPETGGSHGPNTKIGND